MENQNKPSAKRLQSLDALRGFDMFWIVGGREIFIGLAILTGWPVFQWWSEQLNHTLWNGFLFFDMIFPLFLFIAGISFPFSMAKRYHGEENRKALYRHIIKRGLILFLLGLIYNNAITFDFANMNYGSVLGRIGLAWMFAALIFMNTNLKFRIVWCWGILIFYWLVLLLFPTHHLGTTDPFSQQDNLSGYIDRLLMPGQLNYVYGSKEGILNTLPAISTALLGMLTGQFVISKYLNSQPLRKVLYMALAALGLIILGMLWNIIFPINKPLWTSSFVCFTGGISLLLFSIFYLVIDVWQYKKWTFFFMVIGMNPLTIYMADRIINFNSASGFFFGGVIGLFPESWTPFLNGIAITSIGWIFLYFLFKKKVFLKV